MSLTKSLIIPLATGSLLVSPAMAADDAAWAVNAPGASAASMSRTLESVTLTYKRSPTDSDTLRISVAGCGSEPWYMEEDLNGVTSESLRGNVAEEFQNARLNCKLPDGLEDRFMAGFDEAFAKVKPFVAPHTATVGGWAIEDKGSLPGDDSDRTIAVSKTLPTISMVYRPGASDGGSIQIEFKPCDGSSNSSGFDFGNPPEDHLKVINEQVSEAYSDFAKDCKTAPEAQSVLMQGFPEALKTVEQWLAAKPFVYPSN